MSTSVTSPASELALVPNPFEGTVVLDAWQALPADVTSIHAEVFAECLAALDNACRGKSDSLLIYGAAGSGKTHLLSRLQNYLHSTAQRAPDRVLRCVFVSVKLQTNPTQIWQHVRRRLAADLLRQYEGLSQLQRLVAHQIAAEAAEPPRHWVLVLRVLAGTQGESVTEHLGRISEALGLGRDLFIVIDHLVHRRFTMDAAAWLRGESLPDSVLERLGLGRDEVMDREDAARQVVTSLCRLAGATLPIVFCFDQIEALQTHSRDHEALFLFGRAAADLAEADENVLILSCVQSAFLEQLDSIRQADKDRIFKRRATLATLTPQQIEALVCLRMDSVDALAEIRRTRPGSPLYPFGDAHLAELASVSPLVPRKVLARAADLFEALRHGKVSARADFSESLTQEHEARLQEALNRGRLARTAVTLQHGLAMAWAIRFPDAQPATVSEVKSAGTDALLETAQGRVGVVVCHEQSMTGLAGRLRALLARSPAAEPRAERLIILRDARLPISRKAAKTREYLAELEARGARFVQPGPEALAALEALRQLVSDARSGDLNVRGETVGESAVCRWLAANLDDQLVYLLDSLAAPGSDPDADLKRNLADLLLRKFIVQLTLAAQELATPEERVLRLAEQNPERFGLLYGPPAVLFAHTAAQMPAAAESGS
jgi:hypothetical protein